MKKGLDPFRVSPLLKLEDRIESVSCTGDSLYVGTSSGNLVQFSISSTEDLAPRQSASVKLGNRKPVEQVLADDGHLVFALVDGAVHVLPLNISSTSTGNVLCREAKRVCLHTGMSQDGSKRQKEVCVSLKKKLVLYVHNGRSFEQRQEFPITEAASALAWHQSWICVGYRREYVLFSDRNGIPKEICQIDGKFPPQIAVLPNNELLLLIQESVGLFFNLCPQQPQPSPKSTVTWPRKVVNLGAASNYVFGSTGNGQVDIFSIRDQKNCQTLTVEGGTLAMATMGGRLLVAVDSSLTCLDPIPFERQVQKLLLQVRVGDALNLLNANFGSEDPKREEQLNRFHALAGWALFRDLQFNSAFQHFLYTPDVNIARILVFWKKYLPSGWDPIAASRTPAGRSIPDDGAPEACDIEDFVRTRLQEKQSEGGGSASSSSAVSANVEMAKAAAASFLLKQREALRAQDRMPADQRSGSTSDLSALRRAVDTVLLKFLVEADSDDTRLQKVLEAGVQCTIEDCESFLRDRERVDVLARLRKARGMYELVLQEWSKLLPGSSESISPADARKGGTARITRAQVVSEMADALKGAASSPAGADLLRKYVPELLAADPAAVLPIFVNTNPRPGQAQSCALSIDEVLQLLQGHNSLVLGYLEHLVAQGSREVQPQHRAQLALIYVQQVAAERKKTESSSTSAATSSELSPTRRKLLRFLETTEDLDAHALLPRVESMQLHEERVVLCCLAQRHQEALRTIVENLDDLPRAEVYCRILMARHRSRAMASRGDSRSDSRSEEVSVLSTDPPAWARGIAFPMGDEDVSATAARGTISTSRDGNVEVGGPRLLMFFLQVLLDASIGAEKEEGKYCRSSSAYQDAAISLLTSYAGHRDLPPHEVIGILPSGWTLAKLSDYLTRSARFCLHERRASMLEENLSSMAYLKTFSAWAHERMRKVHITGDRCCPVCNRRFVDKDSVGKAFVAYPNETCVHLQCKEDISVCPKTGRNFADNLSVYCHALGMDRGEQLP